MLTRACRGLPALAGNGKVLAAVRRRGEPGHSEWLNDRIAEGADYDALVILLDTPGGLDDSMRKIVQAELSAKEPVVVYVSPQGARAASAGVWISQAADVLCDGAEHEHRLLDADHGLRPEHRQRPQRKVVNDAAASLRALAHSHGRNARWADRAVRRASNLAATRR